MTRNILLIRVLECVSLILIFLPKPTSDRISSNLQSNMMAIAISIISTWWYPRNGISPIESLAAVDELHSSETYSSTRPEISVPLRRLLMRDTPLYDGICHSRPPCSGAT